VTRKTDLFGTIINKYLFYIYELFEVLLLKMYFMHQKPHLFMLFYEIFENFDIYLDKFSLLWYYILVISYTETILVSNLRVLRGFGVWENRRIACSDSSE